MMRPSADDGTSEVAPVEKGETMKALLAITTGPDEGRCCELKTGQTITIGRSSVCDLRLSDQGGGSRIHCRVIADRHGIHLEDLGSRYGTLVNERVVQASSLYDGDTIGIGDTTFQLNLATAIVETIGPRRTVPIRLDSPG